MDAATEIRPLTPAMAAGLAGLEAGMVGVWWMLVWLGVSSALQDRSFWTPENLMATAFHRDALIAPGLGVITFAGMALYFLIYSLVGAVFAWALRGRLPRPRAVLLGVIVALAWYYISFQWLFRYIMPTVAMLHVERATVLGHLLYGALLGRYPVYLRKLQGEPPRSELPMVPQAEAPVVQHTVSPAGEAEPPAPGTVNS